MLAWTPAVHLLLWHLLYMCRMLYTRTSHAVSLVTCISAVTCDFASSRVGPHRTRCGQEQTVGSSRGFLLLGGAQLCVRAWFFQSSVILQHCTWPGFTHFTQPPPPEGNWGCASNAKDFICGQHLYPSVQSSWTGILPIGLGTLGRVFH